MRRRRGEGGGVGRSGQGPPHAPLGRAISGAIFEAREYRQGMRAVLSVPNLPALYSPSSSLLILLSTILYNVHGFSRVHRISPH